MVSFSEWKKKVFSCIVFLLFIISCYTCFGFWMFIFYLLIGVFKIFLHNFNYSCVLGQQARDALLMIMQLSARNSNLAKYIVENTDFCPVKLL